MKQRLQAWGNTKTVRIVSAFVCNEAGELLLLQRHPADLGGSKWGMPGGRIEPGETALEAIARELFEETGVSDVELELLGQHLIHMPHGTVEINSYRTNIPNNTAIVLDPEEHTAYQWFGLANLPPAKDLLWGIPSLLNDFGLLKTTGPDPTLADGSSIEQLPLDPSA